MAVTKSKPFAPTRRSRRIRSLVAATVVTTAAGILFGVAASNARLTGTTGEMNLMTLVEDREQQVEEAAQQVASLRERSDELLATSRPMAAAAAESISPRAAMTGPGLVVTLDDSPSDFQLDPAVNVNDAVVHQQDIDAVMNALWRGGAEAMTVQDVRITSSTPVRCIGNVILVGTRSFAPPYRVAAIGDVEAMVASLDSDPSVSLYREDAARYQLGWDVQTYSEISLPAAEQPTAVRFAVADTAG